MPSHLSQKNGNYHFCRNEVHELLCAQRIDDMRTEPQVMVGLSSQTLYTLKYLYRMWALLRLRKLKLLSKVKARLRVRLSIRSNYHVPFKALCHSCRNNHVPYNVQRIQYIMCEFLFNTNFFFNRANSTSQVFKLISYVKSSTRYYHLQQIPFDCLIVSGKLVNLNSYQFASTYANL